LGGNIESGKMNPNNNAAASTILAAVWPRDDSVDAEIECSSHKPWVNVTFVTPAFGEARFIHGFVAFSRSNTHASHHLLKAPLSFSAIDPAADILWI